MGHQGKEAETIASALQTSRRRFYTKGYMRQDGPSKIRIFGKGLTFDWLGQVGHLPPTEITQPREARGWATKANGDVGGWQDIG